MPLQVMLSLEVIADSEPFSTVISSALLKPVTASENVRVTVAVSPIFSAESESVKDVTAGARVSTEKLAVMAVTPELPAISV